MNTDISNAFYVQIPFYVLQSKLTHCQKIICGAVIGLSAKDGYCYASNETLKTLLGMKATIIRSEISLMYKEGVFINIGTKKNRQLVLNKEYFGCAADPKIPLSAYGDNSDLSENIDSKKEIEDQFEKLWSMYPIKAKKQSAMQKFINMSQKDRLALINTLPVAISYHNQQSTKENFIPTMPHLLTFINQKRWLDDVYFDAKKIEKKGENLEYNEIVPEYVVEMITDALQDEDESAMSDEVYKIFISVGMSFEDAIDLYDKKGIGAIVEKIGNRMRDAV